MWINKFTKLSDGMYRVQFDSFSAVIHEDLILKYDLLLTKKLDSDLLEQIMEENKKYAVYGVALKYLKKKLHSKKEVASYLRREGYQEEDIRITVQLLERQGYLDERQFADAYVHDRMVMSNDGPLKIEKELLDRGISSDIIVTSLAVYGRTEEQEKIEKLIDRQVKQNRKNSSLLLKRKIQGYLSQLGYHDSLIRHSLDQVSVTDTVVAQKEYQKLKNQLSRKYSGKELELKLKQKMYQKGFSINDYEN